MWLTVMGGGPAGAAAAIAASAEGARVELREKARFPRHKVCGEFLSPEIVPQLERLGLKDSLLAANPARIERLSLHFGPREKTARLPEAAYGLSRFVFDKLLFDRAAEHGEHFEQPPGQVIIAQGRRPVSQPGSRGSRLFGFKTHFRGPANDAIELHFFDGGYVGISAIEGGLTNVCGLATEVALARVAFEFDQLLAIIPSVASRLKPLAREMNWLSTGPLIFTNRLTEELPPQAYYAGDALSFVDPFTGSGMYCAVLTGRIAGQAAARGLSSAESQRLCREALGRPFAFASLFRHAITSGWADRMAPIIPAQWLYRLTRPRT